MVTPSQVKAGLPFTATLIVLVEISAFLVDAGELAGVCSRLGAVAFMDWISRFGSLRSSVRATERPNSLSRASKAGHAADDEMCDGLKHPRQSFRHSLDVRVEWKMGAASHFGQNPERMLRRTRATLLKQEQSGSRRAQLLGGSNRVIEVAVKMVANDNHCLNRPLSRFLQGLFEDIAYLDIAAAHAAGPASVHDARPCRQRP